MCVSPASVAATAAAATAAAGCCLFMTRMHTYYRPSSA
eukprot:COSAG05_NODE_1311_length_5218_cov_2.444032_1_plen_37_part_10